MTKTPDPHDHAPASDQNAQPGEQQSTERFPTERLPTASTNEAAYEARRPSVLRRHPLVTGIAAAILAVAVISGLTAWGVGAAVTASLTSSAASASRATPTGLPTGMPTNMPTMAPMAGGAGRHAGATPSGRLAFRATVTSIASGSWTIVTKQGKTVTVSIDDATKFGTKKAAATAGSFAVGDSVLIVATQATDGTPTATRVVERMS